MRYWLSGFLALTVLAGPASTDGAILPTTIVNDWSRLGSPISGTNNTTWSAVGGEVVSSYESSGSLVSDFSTSGDFTFTGTMEALGDNDTMGLLFGFQDMDNHYRMSFSGGGSQERYGLTFVRSIGGNESYLAENSGFTWSPGVEYEFSIERVGNDLTFEVTDTTLMSSPFLATVTDATFMSGGVGLHVYGQEAAFGNVDCSAATTVPEPGSLLVWGLLGLVVLGFNRRRRTR